jgi:hypothetical protein
MKTKIGSNKAQDGRRTRGLLVATTLIVVAGGAGIWVAVRDHQRRHQPQEHMSSSPLATNDDPTDTLRRHHVPFAAPTSIPDTWVKARALVSRKMKSDPKRMSPFAMPEPFDPGDFGRQPEQYLSDIEPARCFQTAKPGPGILVLEAGSTLRSRVAWGDADLLMVKTVPNAPVTFTVFGGGYFKENGVSTISVRADARGLAAAHYTADYGISGDITVVAGSPLASGNQRFFIRVGSSIRG